MESVSAEQYAAAGQRASLAAQQFLGFWLAGNPDATKPACVQASLAAIAKYGPAVALTACAFYQSERNINDGWQILPSDGFRPEALEEWAARDYNPETYLRGLAGLIDVGVKSYGWRTLERRRGVSNDPD
jgi:hypothetical protein